MSSACTRVAAVFGDPISHSLSPVMHNAAFAALKLDGIYLPFRVVASELPAAVRAIRALGFLGANITLPHKFAAARLVDRLGPDARLLSAVNCIVNRARGLYGDNTDARGLELDLKRPGLSLKGKSALVIGAGGGGAAALLAVIRLGVRRVTLVNRTHTRAVGLARRFAPGQVEVRRLNALRDRGLLAEQSLIINATSVSTTKQSFPPMAYAATPEDCFFYDLSYSIEPSVFLQPALQLKRRGADGLGMLLYQGALAFELFNKVPAPVDAMRQALYQALGRPTNGDTAWRSGRLAASQRKVSAR
jgi:shikimate dehydrogenase